jgi:hypothetical protein
MENPLNRLSLKEQIEFKTAIDLNFQKIVINNKIVVDYSGWFDFQQEMIVYVSKNHTKLGLEGTYGEMINTLINKL